MPSPNRVPQELPGTYPHERAPTKCVSCGCVSCHLRRRGPGPSNGAWLPGWLSVEVGALGILLRELSCDTSRSSIRKLSTIWVRGGESASDPRREVASHIRSYLVMRGSGTGGTHTRRRTDEWRTDELAKVAPMQACYLHTCLVPATAGQALTHAIATTISDGLCGNNCGNACHFRGPGA